MGNARKFVLPFALQWYCHDRIKKSAQNIELHLLHTNTTTHDENEKKTQIVLFAST